MGKSLEYIVKRFPDYRSTLINLYEWDEDFRTLCEDYLTSAQALEEYRQNRITDKQFENVFSQMFVELEKEIIHVLETLDK